MSFTTRPSAALENFAFPDMAEIPEGEWMQGSDKTQNNPRRRVHLDRFEVSTGLVTVKDYKRFVAQAQDRGRFGYFGRVRDDTVRHNVKAGDEILYGYAKDRMETGGVSDGFAPYQHLSFMEMGGFHIEEIAPKLDWLEEATQKYNFDPIFLADDTPVTFVSQWDAYAYVAFLNHELARLRMAVASRQIDEASLTQADRLLLTGGWFDLPTAAQMQRVMAGPAGTFVFGTKDGKRLNMRGRPFPHIGPALARDTGVLWRDKLVRHTFGVLWQRTKDPYHQYSNRPDPNGGVILNPRGAVRSPPGKPWPWPELSGGGSWKCGSKENFAVTHRERDPGNSYRYSGVGLRVVRRP